jgi:ABC-type Fe3+/spermidine/putrescine transport system ATPase subunit
VAVEQPAAVARRVTRPTGPAAAPPASVPGLELQAVVKTYGGVEAVRGIDLVVRKGEFLTVLGPSGSGKTTVLRLVSGFTDLTSGQILLAGRNVSNMTPAERGIGMVFQNYALFPHMTAGENVQYGLKMRGWAKAARRARAVEMLELVGLAGMEGRLPREMSGGQQQRVALARALAFGPELLLMDEPLGALDRELRIRMAGELRRIHAELGTTVVYVTHDREEALTLSDRIAIMLAGEVEAVDTPERLFTLPSSSFVATFFGGHNLLPAVVSGAEHADADGLSRVDIQTVGQSAVVRCGGDVEAGRPAALAVPTQAIAVEPPPRPYLKLACNVVEALYMGEVTQVLVTVDVLGPDAGPITAHLPGHHSAGLTPGTRATFFVDLERCVAVPPSANAPELITAIGSSGGDEG